LEPGLYRVSGRYTAGEKRSAFTAEFNLINDIPDYQNTQPLTAEQEAIICADYFNALPESETAYTEPGNIEVKKYGGSYTYGEVVVMRDVTYMVTDDMQYIEIAGQVITLTSGSYRLQLHHDGRFIDIRDAYALGLLNRLDIEKIAAMINGENNAPTVFENHTAVYGQSYGYYEGGNVGSVTAGEKTLYFSIKNDEGYTFTCDPNTAKIEEVGEYNLDVENYYAGIKSVDCDQPKRMKLKKQGNAAITSSLNTNNPGSVDYAKSIATGSVSLADSEAPFEFNKKYSLTVVITFDNGYRQEVSGIFMGVNEDSVILE
jgi:hypothetical protein